MSPRVAPIRGALAAGLLVAVAGGCGGGGLKATAAAPLATQVTSTRCSGSSRAGGGPGVGDCVFVLTDGRRFRCPASRFGGSSAPTPTALERSAACAALAPLPIPASVRSAFAAVGTARACLSGKGLGVTGGPVYPSDPSSPAGPDGELIVGDGTGAAFVAFYADPAKARRLEPTVIQSARRLGGRAERHGAVTVVWVHSPSGSLRTSVAACVLD